MMVLYMFKNLKKIKIMKKILLLALTFLIIGCSNEEQQQTQTPPAQTIDCNCDKVVSVSTFNVIGTPQNPQNSYYTVYTTINVCTQIQKEKTHSTLILEEVPKIGDCK